MPPAKANGWVQSFNGCSPGSRGRQRLGAAWTRSQRHGLSFWDAMLWATAKRAGCRMLFSEDLQDGRRLDGVLFVNPFAPANRKLVDLALPALPRR